ncbi:Glutathione S-transferase [Phytophthora palmivora]|uniref:Glutathione S-transferase n=1 Tax=Phytophthora palmivora TaxID=4796 RepID=A0A2P4Y1A8_9STRA|nr:Glutathione S-transferase [Phytophthora palmivora]
MTTPQLKFTYFPIPARGELSRLVLTYGKIPFEDDRVDFSQWGAMKPNTPLGKLPLLEVDGTSYCQSMAIVRYAAKLGGLYPEDPLECLRVEMVSETLCELSADCIDIVFIEKDEIKKVQKTNTLLQETIPFKLGVLTKLIKGDYFVGDKVSFADIQVFDLFENALSKFSAGFTATTYPELDAIVKRVKENTEISAYLKKHSP